MKAPEKFPITIKRGSTRVKIYRQLNGGYDQFMLAWHDGTKRRRQKFSAFSEAKREAESIATKLCRGELDVLELKSEDRLCYVRSLAAVRPLAVPLDGAVCEYAEARKRLGETPLLEAVDFYLRTCPKNLPSKTVQEVFDEILSAKERDGCSKVYLKDIRFRVGKFSDAFHCQIASIRAGELNEYLRSLKCSPRGRNNHRTALATFFRFAESKGYLPKNHADFDRVDRARETHSAIQVFSNREMTALLNAALEFRDDERPGVNRRYTDRAGLITYLSLGAFAGLRTAEIQRQVWTDILLDRGFIRVTAVKGNTAQKRLVPIADNLREWLAFCWREDGPCCEYRNLADAVYRVSERAGVPWKHNALRHSYISNRVAHTQNIPQTSIEAGNSVAVINRHYRELVTPDEAKSWFEIRPARDAKILPMACGDSEGQLCHQTVTKNVSNSVSC